MESNDNKCVICYETITNSVKLECNHIFCLKCIFLSSKNNNDIVKCSLCRKIINFDNNVKRNVFKSRIEFNESIRIIEAQRREEEVIRRERERQQLSHEYRTLNNMFCFCIICEDNRERRQERIEIIKNIFQQIKNNKKILRVFGEYRSFKRIEEEYYHAYITSIDRYNRFGKTNDRKLRTEHRSEQAFLYAQELITRQEKYINDVPMIQLKRKQEREEYLRIKNENINKSLNKIIIQNDIINY